MDHIMRCPAPSRRKWRIKLCSSIRAKLQVFKIPFEVGDVLCSALTEWFDTGEVNPDKYPRKFHDALWAQQLIGWRHFFLGRIAIQWLDLFPSYFEEDKYHESYIWGAAIVELVLREVLALWDERNKEVYGKTESETDDRQRELLSHQVNKLQKDKDNARPSDQFMFKKDPKKCCKEATLAEMKTYIVTNKNAISNSVKQAKKLVVIGTRSLLQYFDTIKPNGETRIMQRLREKFRYESFNKKKKRKEAHQGEKPLGQKKINGYLTLRGAV